MNPIITGIILLLVGFGGGFFVAGSNNVAHHDDAHMAGEHEGHGHAHGTLEEVPQGSPVPTVALEVLEDPKGGWNAKITTTNFRFAPENVSTEHILGEGHAHIYVDGVKINRMYGPWYHLGNLSEGSREVRVELSANNHNAYAVNGERIEDIVTVVVEPKPVFDADNAQMIALALSERSLSPQTVTVTEGDSVHFKITTDEAGEFHITGYEIEKAMSVDGTTDIMFVADNAGRYALEIHPGSSSHMMEGEGHMMEGEKEDIEVGSLIVNPR